MTEILDGNKLRDRLAVMLSEQISRFAPKPKLVIIQIGDLEESNAYIAKKKDFASQIGALIVHEKYPEGIAELEVVRGILKYNQDKSVHGIMVQLPIPGNLGASGIVEAIDWRKDVDGLTAQNTKRLFDNEEAFVPATTKGIMTLLESHDIHVRGQKVVVVGDSALVGRPTALAMLNKRATVTICHRATQDLAAATSGADILIVAVGEPNLITVNHVSENQVVVDVGITVQENHKVVGDVDYEKVREVVKAITPVPGGVGPMTVYSLFENLVLAYRQLV